MTMIVNGQQLASMTSLFLEKNHGNLARGLNRLSSGIRFATSADDAGNLAVSVKLNSSLKRSAAVHKNVQNARSFLSMQEDAYKQLGKVIDRMAELRTQFDDPIKAWSDKKNLNLEFKELQEEVIQMSRSKLNGVSLFSTEDQSKFPFYLPTDDTGSRVQVTRTGFFDSLKITTQGVGITPNFTISGNTGTMGLEAFTVAPQGTAPDTDFNAIQGTMAFEDFTVGMSHSPNGTLSTGTDYNLKPTVRIRDGAGTVIDTVAASNVTLNGDGTLSIDLSSLPGGITAAGNYTVKADDGTIYLDPTELVTSNHGSGYGAVPGFQVTAPDGSPATDVAAAVSLVGDKLTITASGTPTQVGDYVISIDDGPLTSNLTNVTSSDTTDDAYDTSGAKPTVRIYDSTGAGTPIATVSAGAVTVNDGTGAEPAGTVSIDLSSLPAALVAAGAGNYTVKADDGAFYLEPSDLVTNNVGSGYGSVPTFSIIAPDNTVNPGDVTASLALSGDKVNVTASGTPTQLGTYKVRIDDGPLTSDTNSVTSSDTTDDAYNPAGAKPAVKIYDSTGVTLVGTVPASAVTVNDGTGAEPAGTVSIDLSNTATLTSSGITAGGDYTVKADNGALYLDPSDLVTNNVGSGYGALPSHSIIAPDNSVNPGDVTASLVLSGDKVNVTVSGTPTQLGVYKVSIAAGPLTSATNKITSSATTDVAYDTSGSKPTVKIYDAAGTTLVGTVPASAVTLNDGTGAEAAGTVSTDLSNTATLATAGITTSGTYTVKADDGSIYVNPSHASLTNVGSGYAALPSSVKITGPGGTPTVVTQDPATTVSVDGANFDFTLVGDKLTIATSGSPTKVGNFTIEIDDGPLSSATSKITSSNTTDGLFETEPVVKLYDAAGTTLVGTVPASAVTLNDGTGAEAAGTVSTDLSSPTTLATAGVTTAGTYTVKADDGLKLSSKTLTAGSGYAALPTSITLEGPSGGSVSADPNAGSIGPVDGVTVQSVALSTTNPGELDVTLSGTPTAAGTFTITIPDGPPQGTASTTGSTVEGTTTGATGAVTTSVIVGTGTTATELWNTGTVGTSATEDVDTQPAISSTGTLYFISSQSNAGTRVHSVNSSDGTENWAVNTGVESVTNPTLSSDESTLYVATENGRVIAYNVADGSTRWTYNSGSNQSMRQSQPAESNDGSTIYVGSTDNNLHAINTADGSQKWTFNAGNDIESNPIVDSSGVIYFGTDNRRVYAVQDNGASGTQVWRHNTFDRVESSPGLSADESTLYVGDNIGTLYAIDTTSGNVNWSEFTTGFSFSSIKSDVVVGANGNIYFSANNRRLYAYQDNGSSGTELGNFQVDPGGQERLGRCAPVVSATNRVFLSAGDGNAYALDGTDPGNWGSASSLGSAVEWVGSMGTASKSTPVLSADGSIAYVGSDNNRLYAFTDPASGFQLDASSVTIGKDYLSTDSLATGDITLSGTAAAGVTVSTVTNNNDGTFTIGLGGTPTSAGTITVASSKNGAAYLKPLSNVGSGYPPALTPAEIAALSVTITPAAVGGGTIGGGGLAGSVASVNADGSLNLTFTGTADTGGDFTVTVANGPAAGTTPGGQVTVNTSTVTMAGQTFVVAAAGTAPDQTVTTLQGTMAGQTFNVAPAGASVDVDVDALQGTMAGQAFKVSAAGTAPDVDLDSIQGTMAAQGFTIAPAGTASDVQVTAKQGTMSSQALTVGIMANPTPIAGGANYAAKPAVQIYDSTGATAIATVDPSQVTLNAGGVSIDLSTLPAAVTTAGNYKVKADDGPLYIDSASNPATNVGSGYTAVPSLNVVAPDGTLNPGDVTAALTLVGDKLTVTASGTPLQKGVYQVQIADGSLAASTTSITSGTGYDPSETPVTTVYDAASTAMGTVPVTNNGDGTITIDLSTLPAGVASAGNYTVQSANGAIATTPPPVTVGAGYDISEPVPAITFTGGPVGTLSVASSTINPDGTVGITFAGNPSGSGPVSVSVGSGTTSTQAEGLMNEDLDLWDFAMSDFTRYIQVLANVRSVNGAESSSFTFSERLLTNNYENLEMATGRITDTDVAAEMVEVAKHRIKTSTAADMLAKHNKLGMMVDLTVMNLA
ncbi:MAG: hypothetical protein CMI30_07535 [Opitutae bacterium]|nr:hypothetical protein [Opitutae bacterium]